MGHGRMKRKGASVKSMDNEFVARDDEVDSKADSFFFYCESISGRIKIIYVGHNVMFSSVFSSILAERSDILVDCRDSALLALPSSFSDQLPPEGGAFYKAERAEVGY